ncbi:MAG: T9SS type A sorting domain-containing protein [Cryomorphaceae bacterium]
MFKITSKIFFFEFGLLAFFLALLTPTQAQQLENVIVEEYFQSASSTTYRVYLDMGPNDKLLSVFGYYDEDSETGNILEFKTTTTFFQDPLGEDFGHLINPVLFSAFQDLALDTYLTLGSAASGLVGVPEQLDNDGSQFIDFKNPDGFKQASAGDVSQLGLPSFGQSEITANNGAYFINSGLSGVGVQNVILIGQFTTDGEFSFKLNVHLRNGFDEAIFAHSNETFPDGSSATLDSTLEFSSQGTSCAAPFPAVLESSLNSFFTGSSILTEWDPLPNQIGCQIAVRFAGGSLLGTQIIGGEFASSFNIPGSVLQPGTDYEWRVRCGCSQSPLIASPFSSWQPFSTPEGAGLQVLSNTATDHSTVTFTIADGGRASLEVFDITGKRLASLFSGVANPGLEYRFDYGISHLPTGLYLYRLTTEEEVKTEKFILAR